MIPLSDHSWDVIVIGAGLLGWVAGSTMIWSALFTVGNFLYGRLNYALMLLLLFLASGLALLFVIHALWSEQEQPEVSRSEARVLETTEP